MPKAWLFQNFLTDTKNYMLFVMNQNDFFVYITIQAIIIISNFHIHSSCSYQKQSVKKSSWCILYVLLTMHPYTISQINPTRCTILFIIFICFSSVHVSGIHVPIIRRKLLYLCDTGIWHAVWVASGLLVWLKWSQSNQQTRRHPYRVTNTSVV